MNVAGRGQYRATGAEEAADGPSMTVGTDVLRELGSNGRASEDGKPGKRSGPEECVVTSRRGSGFVKLVIWSIMVVMDEPGLGKLAGALGSGTDGMGETDEVTGTKEELEDAPRSDRVARRALLGMLLVPSNGEELSQRD